jgi:hypothetical protein
MGIGRTLLAGIAGGVGMFVWASIAHVALPLATIGVREITTNEPALLSDMQSSLGANSGLYLFPSLGWKPGDSSERKGAAMRAYEGKLATNPSGLLMYHPPGQKAITAGQLLTEFLAELVATLIAVFLLLQAHLATYAARVGFITLAGILAAIPTNVSYWNWYGFPASYTAVYMFIQIVGFIVAGLIAAAILGRRKASSATAAT